MKTIEIEKMSIDQLWDVHVELSEVLAAKLAAEKKVLEERIQQLQAEKPGSRRVRRPYPPVFPKFRNPADHSETWSGRGKQPRWFAAQLHSGKKLEDLTIGFGGRQRVKRRIAR